MGIGGEQGCVGLDCGDRLELPTLVMFSQPRTLGEHTPGSLSQLWPRDPRVLICPIYTRLLLKGLHITSHYSGMGAGGCVKVQGKIVCFLKEKNIKAQLKMICEVSVPQPSLLRSHLPDIS